MEAVFKPISLLSKELKTGVTSPVDLTEIFLERLESLGSKYNAIVTITRERARGQAEKMEKELNEGIHRGPLHGIPYGSKDLLATAGIPTTWGAAPFRERIFNYDATVIKRLEKAGAILCAKLAMIELAGGMGYRQPIASFSGPTKNPWNRDYWTGGSSSGSGASVAAGLVPFALGSETWGSILSPANNCGVSGLRPTYGRVSRYGAMALSWSLDKIGPLCLTADDCGLVLEAIAGPDPLDRTTYDRKFLYVGSRDKGFKLAILKDYGEELDPEVESNFNDSIRVLEKFSSIEEIEFPDLPYEAVTRIILNSEAASAFENLAESGIVRGLTAPVDRYGIYPRTAVLAKDYIKALRLRGIMAQEAEEHMAPYDAVIAPARSSPATPIGSEFRKKAPGTQRDIMGALGNGAGLPSISVPNGFTELGLPTGIQFMGRAYDENRILDVAKAYQKHTRWHTMHPEI